MHFSRVQNPQRDFVLVNEQIISIRQLGIYNDGMIVVGWNTDEFDLIIEEVMTWATQTFRLREPITRTRRVYISSVVVEFDFPIERAFHTLSEFIRIYEAALKSAYDWEFPMNRRESRSGQTPLKCLSTDPRIF